MPTESQTDPRKGFAPRFLPLLLGGVMLAAYLATLNHWVTLINIGQVANVLGWNWQPEVVRPLTLLVTLPFRLLPAAMAPMALNLFSCLCAVASLAMLARMVAILPHDRTELERSRERSDFCFLTGRVAWLPPIVAVGFAGFHLGFWQNATSFSSDSFELLWFAVILWQLVEYRIGEHEGRLFAAAALYGAGMVEDWALVAFFPLFLVMVSWLRGRGILNVLFLLRIILCGFAGLLLLLVVAVPLSAHFTGAFAVGAWDAIKYNLRENWQVIKLVYNPSIRHDLALIALTSLLPAFVMSLRWSTTFGDNSPMGVALVNFAMHLVNLVFLGIMVWLTFDPPFSPFRLLSEEGLRVPALKIYYLAALCIGYYSGYFLLVFGQRSKVSSRSMSHQDVLPSGFRWLAPVIVACAVASLGLGIGMLVYKNGPAMAALNDDSIRQFGRFTAQQLPPDGAILLCDSDSPDQDLPLRSYFVQAELARDGRARKYPVVDTHSLQISAYHHYLHQRFPNIWPEFQATNDLTFVNPAQILTLLDQLSQSNQLCYLNPSFGYYFERFYQEPHGLVYFMKTLPAGTLLPPPLTTNLMAENEAFWQQVVAASGPAIHAALKPRNLALQGGLPGRLFQHLHMKPDANPNALTVGQYYSKSLDSLGVLVQRAGDPVQAANLFTEALDLNPDNAVASVNLEFNKVVQSGSTTTVDLARATADRFGKHRGWNEVMGADGPYDDTSFCFALGCWMVQDRLFHQALALFDRVRHLAPDNLAARLFLAQIYVLNRQPDLALQALHDPLNHPFRFALTDANSTELNELTAAAYFQKGQVADGVALLEKEMDRHPNDEKLLLTVAQTLNTLGLHTNALETIGRQPNHAADDPDWLYGKGIVSLQAGAYDDAVAALSRYLDLRTNHPAAFFQRGLAYYRGGHLDEARADFLRLQRDLTNNIQIAGALGEIAWRRRETNEAIRNYRIYLANTPTNAPEHQAIRERLTKLDGK